MSLAGLRQAAPYIRHYRDQVFLVKVGGEAVAKAKDRVALLEQVSVLIGFGVKVVLVHGGGPQATETAAKLGVKSEFVAGRRVTDEGMLEALVMTLCGSVRTDILATAKTLGISAVGMSGVDANIGEAKKREIAEVDFGYVGEIVKVDVKMIDAVLEKGSLPVLSPLCVDSQGQVLNVNADTFASRVAVALGAAKLILVTGARGIMRDLSDPTSLVSVLDLENLRGMAADGSMKDGMLPKASAIEYALENGVRRVHIVSYQYEDSLLTEVFTNEGCGTMVVRTHDES